MSSPWSLGARNPLPSSGRAILSARVTKVTSTTSLYSTAARIPAASGQWGSSSLAATGAGAVRITRPASTGPSGVASDHPDRVRPIFSTGVQVRIDGPRAAARASVTRGVPPRTPIMAGPASAPSPPARRASARGPPRRRASCSREAPAARLMASADPPLMPPSSGSTSLSNASSPKRGRSTSPTAASPVSGGAGRFRPARSFSTPAAETRPERAAESASRGTPSTDGAGMGRRAPSAQMKARRAAGATRSAPNPSRRHRSAISGRRARKPSGPDSTRTPPTADSATAPPTRPPASSTTASAPSRRS